MLATVAVTQCVRFIVTSRHSLVRSGVKQGAARRAPIPDTTPPHGTNTAQGSLPAPAIPRAVFSQARSPPLSHGSACACRAHSDRGRPSDDGGPALTERTVKLPPTNLNAAARRQYRTCSPSAPTNALSTASLAPCLGAILKIEL